MGCCVTTDAPSGSELIGFINRNIPYTHVFHIAAPVSLTVKLSSKYKGGYTKKAFIGNEELRLTGAYAGKRVPFILTFQHVDFDTSDQIEIPLDDCENVVSGFASYFQNILMEFERSLLNESKTKRDALELDKYISARATRQLEHPEFGSW